MLQFHKSLKMLWLNPSSIPKINISNFKTSCLIAQRHWESRSYYPKTDDDSNGRKQHDFRSENSNLDELSIASQRAKSVTSYYYQSAIDIAALKQSVRLTPASLLYSGKNQEEIYILRSASYLHQELPVRIAHRVAGFRSLPFIVGCNPTILAVHELYLRAFRMLSTFPDIETMEDDVAYTKLLKRLLEDHKDVVTSLAEGFSGCRKHISDNSMVRQFLDRTLTSRLGIRMLAEHHIALHEDRPNHIGIVKLNFSPKRLIDQVAKSVKHSCESKFGVAPKVIVDGHVNLEFAYISQPVEYILSELLKNAARATVEAYGRPNDASLLPDIICTITSNDDEFTIRVSDQGGGIPREVEDKIWQYHVSTSQFISVDPMNHNRKSSPTIQHYDNDTNDGVPTLEGWGEEQHNSNRSEQMFEFVTDPDRLSPMFGFGFGLPTSKAYAAYLGGSLEMQTMRGMGTDIYLTLRHIDSDRGSFRI